MAKVKGGKKAAESRAEKAAKALRQRASELEASELEASLIVNVDELEPDVERVLAELGDVAVTVYLERQAATGGKWSMVDTIPAREFTLMDVKNRFGGGAFRARIIDKENQYKTARNFYIEGAPVYPVTAVVEAAPALGEVGVLAMLLREVLQEVRKPVEMGPVKGENSLDGAIKIVQMVQAATAPLVAAVMQSQKRGDDESPIDTWDYYERGLDMGERLNKIAGGDPQTEMMLGLGKEVVGILRSGKDKAGAVPAKPAAPQLAPGAPQWAGFIAPFLPQLVGWAQQNKNAELYAEVVLDNLTPGGLEFLTAQLRDRPVEFRQEFTDSFPAIARFQPWFDSLFMALGALLTGEQEEPDASMGDVQGTYTPEVHPELEEPQEAPEPGTVIPFPGTGGLPVEEPAATVEHDEPPKDTGG